MVYLPYVSKSESASAPEGGIPYGPIRFGMDSNDYDHPKAVAFNGASIHLGEASPAQEEILQAARDHALRIVVSLADTNPCTYWDGSNFDHDSFVGDVLNHVETVAGYYPDTVIGVLLLNEPHDPLPECEPEIPPIYLYNAAKDIRAAFAEEGAGDIPLGFWARPLYIERGLSDSQARDGTITLSFLQWRSGKDPFDLWAAEHKAAAARMSEDGFRHWIVYSVNCEGTSDQEVIQMNTWACGQDDAFEVQWHNWRLSDGPKDTIPLAHFLAVRAVCDAN